MRAYAIVITGNEVSERGFDRLVKSSEHVGNDFTINKSNAVTPFIVDAVMRNNKLRWNYPWEGQVNDFASGLVKSAYKTANPKARMACACSHYELWDECASTNTTMLILEHDALFTRKLDFDPHETSATIIGINNPRGATRRAGVYYDAIQNSTLKFQPVPLVDDITVPQGLAGNSAYIIKPAGAKKLLELVKTYGLWPNDAIMCRQLLPKLAVTKTFYTTVQGLESTTSL